MLMQPKKRDSMAKKKDSHLNVITSVVKVLKLDLVKCEGKEESKEEANFKIQASKAEKPGTKEALDQDYS